MRTRFHLACAAAVALPLASVSAQHSMYSYTGPTGFDQLGRAVAGIGDMDRDGYRDFAVGAPQIASIGYVQLFGGADGRLMRTLKGSDIDDTFGYAVCGDFDIDRDGYADVLVGAPQDCG